MRKQNQREWKVTTVDSNTNKYSYTDLDVDTRYEFKVYSRSPLGDGMPSALLIGRTLTGKLYIQISISARSPKRTALVRGSF